MISSVELQVISRILTSNDELEVEELCAFDESYYSVFSDQIKFILDHRSKYNDTPDIFTFQAEFPDITLVDVAESTEYLKAEMRKNKQYIVLVETFNKLKDLGSGDVQEAWQYLSDQCNKVSNLDNSLPLDIVRESKERSNKIIEFSNQSRIPTGFKEIDKLMYGGLSTVEELLILVARTNSGKAQPLWAPVLTPRGWTTMGELKVGDVVVGENNDNGRVVQIFPQGIKDYYRVHFDDGTYAECCDDHLWKVLSGNRRARDNKDYGVHEVITLQDIRNNLDARYSVDISDPIEFESDFDVSAELDGYLLGLILGDGSLRDGRVVIANYDEEIWANIEQIVDQYNCKRSEKSPLSIISKSGRVNYVKQKIVEYGLLNVKSTDKFIPKQYLTAPVHVRKALLAGLVDTDGYSPKDTRQLWEFDTASEQLALDFVELARSLGVAVKLHDRKPSFYTKDGVRIQASGSRHITCRSEFNPFRLTRKASRFSVRTVPYKRSMPKRHCKMITSVEYIGQTECQCILLDNVSHTYVTSGYTVTHNTWFCTKLMESAQKAGFPVLYYSPEMQGAYMGTRFDTWRGHFKNSELMQGQYTPEYLEYLESLKEETTSAYILEDKDVESGDVSVATLRNIVKRQGIKLLIVDGLSYMADRNPNQTDYIKYKNLCLDLFQLSKQFECAVVVAMQANRETKESKDDKGEPFPNLYNVEGSDHPARIATQAFSLRQVFDKHVLDIRLEKSRMASNQKPILSYAWDVNTGNVQYIEGDEDIHEMSTPKVAVDSTFRQSDVDTSPAADDDFEDDDIEF